MPAYNSEATIDAAIESVLSQTRDNFELIVVDDGSTDKTVSRIERYSDGSRIKLITQPHLGPSAARNAAIADSVGEYVSLLDSDDVWLPRYLEVMEETLNANPQAAVAFTDAWVLNDDIKKVARRTAMSAWRPTTDPLEPAAFLRALLERGNFVYASATIRRSVLVDVGGFREALSACVDYELWLRIAANGYRFIRCPEILAVYRRRRGGQITSSPATMKRALLEVFRIVAEEYSATDEIRALALRLMKEQESGISKARQHRRSSRLPPAAFRLYKPLWRLRWFYLRPPAELREAFPNIDVI